jgi:hypothetical protein
MVGSLKEKLDKLKATSRSLSNHYNSLDKNSEAFKEFGEKLDKTIGKALEISEAGSLEDTKDLLIYWKKVAQYSDSEGLRTQISNSLTKLRQHEQLHEAFRLADIADIQEKEVQSPSKPQQTADEKLEKRNRNAKNDARVLYDYFQKLDKNSELFESYGTRLESQLRDHINSTGNKEEALLHYYQVANNLVRWSDFKSAGIIYNVCNELRQNTALKNNLSTIDKLEALKTKNPEETANELFRMAADYYSKIDVKNTPESKLAWKDFSNYLESDLQRSIGASVASKISVDEQSAELERWIRVMDNLMQRGDYATAGAIRITIEKLNSQFPKAREGLSPDLKTMLNSLDPTKLDTIQYYEQKKGVTIPFPRAIIGATERMSEEPKIEVSESQRSITQSISSKSSVEEKRKELEQWIQESNKQRRQGDYEAAAEIRVEIDHLKSSTKEDKELKQAFKELSSDGKNFLKKYNTKSLDRLSEVSRSHKEASTSVSEIKTEPESTKLSNFIQKTKGRTEKMLNAINKKSRTIRQVMMEQVKLEQAREDLQEIKNAFAEKSKTLVDNIFKKSLERIEKYAGNSQKFNMARGLLERVDKEPDINEKVRILNNFINGESKHFKHQNPLNTLRKKEFGLVKIAKEMRQQLIDGEVDIKGEIRKQQKNVVIQQEVLVNAQASAHVSEKKPFKKGQKKVNAVLEEAEKILEQLDSKKFVTTRELGKKEGAAHDEFDKLLNALNSEADVEPVKTTPSENKDLDAQEKELQDLLNDVSEEMNLQTGKEENSEEVVSSEIEAEEEGKIQEITTEQDIESSLNGVISKNDLNDLNELDEVSEGLVNDTKKEQQTKANQQPSKKIEMTPQENKYEDELQNLLDEYAKVESKGEPQGGSDAKERNLISKVSRIENHKLVLHPMSLNKSNTEIKGAQADMKSKLGSIKSQEQTNKEPEDKVTPTNSTKGP